jgi:hypothetical protein
MRVVHTTASGTLVGNTRPRLSRPKRAASSGTCYARSFLRLPPLVHRDFDSTRRHAEDSDDEDKEAS